MKIKPTLLAVFGTRPEAIKMCPLIIKLKSSPFFDLKLCVSGQHRDMLDSVLEEFGVVPDFDLQVMSEAQTPAQITAKILERITPIMSSLSPDALLVHGDTSTALAAALSAFYLRIPVCHVEAGLRSFDLSSPFPEEFNRVAIDKLSELCFAPTKQAERNLLLEGKNKERIFVTGNTVIDSLIMCISKDYRSSLLPKLLPNEQSRFALLTLHRRENIGEPMKNILRAIRRVVEEHPELSVLFPVHKNPAVRSIAAELLSECERIITTEPMSCGDFRNMLVRCDIVLSDSGGIQEEAAFLGKPTLVLRNTTERSEVCGNLVLTGTEEESVYQYLTTLLKDRRAIEKMSHPSDAYGKGDASDKIISALYKYFFN